MKKFSKLKKQIDNLFDPKLRAEFCCQSFPVRGQWGHHNSIPRFYVRLNKEVIWDFPKDFKIKELAFYYWADCNGISEIVREYIDTPTEELPDKVFTGEKKVFQKQFDDESYEIEYHLTDIFKAVDKRLGKQRLIQWTKKVNNPIVDKIIDLRFRKVPNKEIV